MQCVSLCHFTGKGGKRRPGLPGDAPALVLPLQTWKRTSSRCSLPCRGEAAVHGKGVAVTQRLWSGMHPHVASKCPALRTRAHLVQGAQPPLGPGSGPGRQLCAVILCRGPWAVVGSAQCQPCWGGCCCHHYPEEESSLFPSSLTGDHWDQTRLRLSRRCHLSEGLSLQPR